MRKLEGRAAMVDRDDTIYHHICNSNVNSNNHSNNLDAFIVFFTEIFLFPNCIYDLLALSKRISILIVHHVYHVPQAVYCNLHKTPSLENKEHLITVHSLEPTKSKV